MILKTLILLLFSFICFGAHSQDTASVKKFEQRTIYPYGSGYQINGQKVRYREIKNLFNKYDDASAEYLISSKKSGTSALLYLGSLVLGGVGIGILNHNEGVGTGLLIGSIATQIIMIPISLSAKKHFQKSMWLYNRDVMRN